MSFTGLSTRSQGRRFFYRLLAGKGGDAHSTALLLRFASSRPSSWWRPGLCRPLCSSRPRSDHTQVGESGRERSGSGGGDEAHLRKRGDSVPRSDAESYRRASILEQMKSIPNIITAGRIAGTPVLSYLIVTERYDTAVIGCALLAFSDWLDGYVAKNYEGQATVLGSYLDPLADKLMASQEAGGFGPTLGRRIVPSRVDTGADEVDPQHHNRGPHRGNPRSFVLDCHRAI